MSAITDLSAYRRARRGQAVGVVLWPAFLAAAAATMVFFAIFDPTKLGEDYSPPAWLADRMTGYAIGFFFFWIVAAVSSSLTACLLAPRVAAHRSGRPRGRRSSV